MKRGMNSHVFCWLFGFCYELCAPQQSTDFLHSRETQRFFYWAPLESISLLASVFPLKATAFWAIHQSLALPHIPADSSCHSVSPPFCSLQPLTPAHLWD